MQRPTGGEVPVENGIAFALRSFAVGLTGLHLVVKTKPLLSDRFESLLVCRPISSEDAVVGVPVGGPLLEDRAVANNRLRVLHALTDFCRLRAISGHRLLLTEVEESPRLVEGLVAPVSEERREVRRELVKRDPLLAVRE